MSNCVPPLKVSPFIKTFRWTLLILGYLYGANRKRYLTKLEQEERPKRKAALLLKHKRLKELDRQNTINEVMEVGKSFEITEFPPGWESSL